MRYMGAGPCGVACAQSGRRFIGVELDEQWFGPTVDRIAKEIALRDGTLIPIEERGADEVLFVGGVRVAAEGVRVRNPAFDVTPWSLITAIVTERGLHLPGPDGYHFD